MAKTNDEFEKRLAEQMRKSKSATPAAGATAAAAAQAGAAPVGAPGPETAPKSAAGPVGLGDHIVRAGECVSSIAKQTGHFWETIWNDAANSELKSIRKQPNVLLEGDRITVPALRPKEESGQTEMRHRFRRRGEPSHLRIRVLDQDKPMAGMPFKLIIDNSQTIEGMTDAEGVLDVPIPGNAKKGELCVGDKAALDAVPTPYPGGAGVTAEAAGQSAALGKKAVAKPSTMKKSQGDEAGTQKEVVSNKQSEKGLQQQGALKLKRYSLNLGGLDPIDTWSGVQQRLNNMGIHCKVTNQKDDQTMDAVNEFRARNGKPAANDLDEETRLEIQQKHGS